MRQRRKKYWIDTIQTKLSLRIAAYCLIYQAVLWILLIFSQQLCVFLELLLQHPLPTGSWLPSVLVLILLSPLLVNDVIRFAHRFVGPMYRFRKTIQALADGEPVQRIRLRKGDFLQEFKDDFNRLLD